MDVETIISLIFCPLGLAFLLFGIIMLTEPKRKQKNAIHTGAKIVDIYTTKFKSNTTYHYKISFSAYDGTPMKCEVENMKPNFRVGEIMPIYYMMKKPKKVFIENDKTHIFNFIWILLGVCILAFGLMPFII